MKGATEVRKRSKTNAHGAANVECRLGDAHTSSASPPWNVEHAYFYVHHLNSICSSARGGASFLKIRGVCGSSHLRRGLISRRNVPIANACTGSSSLVALCGVGTVRTADLILRMTRGRLHSINIGHIEYLFLLASLPLTHAVDLHLTIHNA